MSVDLSISNGVATILLNRPAKLNAFSDTMWLSLRDHLDRCATDDGIRAVILTGAGRGFSAGADISGEGKVIERKPGIAGVYQMMDFYQSIVRRLYHLPKPVVAAVQGPVVGIAWSLALCCDWLLAAPETKFRPAFMSLGKVPEGGFQFLVARNAGQFVARDLAYRSHVVSGTEALDMRLVTRLVPAGDLLADATAMGEEAAAMAPLAFRYAKELFNAQSGNFDAFLEQEMQKIAIAASTSDAKEGMTAFVEKRQARFVGT